MTCITTIKAPIYDGTDSVITLALIADGGALSDLSPVTRVVVDMDGGTNVIDSNVSGSDVIWWTDTDQYRGQTVDVLRLRLGNSGIPEGTYNDVEITVYDQVYINGLRIENAIEITVQP